MNLESMTREQLIEKIKGRSQKRHQGKEELERPGKFLSSLIAHLTGGIVIENEKRQVLLANEKFCGMFDITEPPMALGGAEQHEETVGMVHLLADGGGFAERVKEILNAGRPVHNEELVLDDGRVLERDYIPVEAGSGRTEHIWHYRDMTEQRRTEKELYYQKQFNIKILNAFPNVLYVYDLQERKHLFLNRNASRILGIPEAEKEMPGADLLSRIIHPDDLPKGRAHLQKMASAAPDSVHEMEYRLKDTDGSWRWFRSYDTVFRRDEHGRVTQIIGSARDITDRKKAEEDLRRSEQRYQNFIYESIEGIYRLELEEPMDTSLPVEQQIDHIYDNAFIAEHNQTYAEMYNLSPDDSLVGKRLVDLHGGWDNPTNREVVREYVTSGYRISNEETEELTSDGEQVWFSNNSIGIVENGKLTDVWGTQIDITDRKEAEGALQESEEKYRTLIEDSGDAIYLLHERRFELINRKFQEMFGVSIEDVNRPGFDFIQLVAPESRPMIEERLNRREAGEQPDRKYEFTALDADGRKIDVEASVTYIKYRGRTAVQGIIRDVTERKRLEEQLRQAQKMEAIGQLAGGVAHDFNNLLTVISGYTNMLIANSRRPEFRESLEQIRVAGEKANRLTSQLLAFSRRQIVQPEIINLNSLVEDQLKMLQRLLGENILVETYPSSDLENIKADPGQIEQIIMNVVINARDAMPAGGKLTIKTENVHLDPDYKKDRTVIRRGEYVKLSITDNGIGLSEDIRKHIFEPFFTTKGRERGTGLGLATVYGIVKQNKGHIRVTSEVGEGTKFAIFLPVSDEKGDEPVEELENQGSLKGNERILLVEDDGEVRELTRSILSEYGYDVYTAEHGREALRIFNQRPEHFDLLLTDVVMPEMGGRELAKRLITDEYEIKVIYFSGYTDSRIIRQGVLDEDVNFIQKPFSNVDLVRRVREALDS